MTGATSEPRTVDPIRLADVVLGAAIRSGADAVVFDPGEPPDTYFITLERASEVLVSFPIHAQSAVAAIARLAYMADLDLVTRSPASAIIKARTGAREADVVITIRPGAQLRAELAVLAKTRPPLRAVPVVVDESGDLIGNYRTLERLGEGGMGTVYRVEHVVLGRQYALKVLRARIFERDPAAAQRFVREARAAARVRHPHIVDVFDFGYLADDRPYFVMELCEGESLSARIRGCGALPPEQAVAIARQIAQALAAVHAHGVVHADVTPSNVFVVGDAPLHVKLLDFGLAAIAGENYDEGRSEFVLGTPAYISPEQLSGLPASDRSDQYSLACVLFAMLAGHPPYVHESVREVSLMHVHAPVPTVESPRGPLPPLLVDIVTTCLQKSPQARFPGMRALVTALEDVERVLDRRGWQKWLT